MDLPCGVHVLYSQVVYDLKALVYICGFCKMSCSSPTMRIKFQVIVGITNYTWYVNVSLEEDKGGWQP